VPYSLLDAPVSDRALRLWGLLAVSGVLAPARAQLAAALGCSVSSIDRAVGELVDAGYLAIERGHRDGTLNRYRLVDPSGPPGDAGPFAGGTDAPEPLPDGAAQAGDRPLFRDLPPLARAIFDRDGWICQRCGSHQNLTVDHVVPRAKGGTDDPSNLQTLCGSCNSSKGAR
jgi:hypothetical protein